MSEEKKLNYNPVDSAVGMMEGKEVGVKEGGEKYRLKVALKCLIKGMDVQNIAEITDLPVERIELLKNAVQKENAGHK